MHFNLQPTLSNELITISPLKSTDFERLYVVASDPLIWEQHPNWDRYKRDVFQRFFDGAIASGGAFLVTETVTGNVIGSSRFYDLNVEQGTVAVGYTFIGRSYWGKPYNKVLKTLMFNYAFQYIDRIILHVAAINSRSQKAIEKLGGKKFEEVEIIDTGSTQIKFGYEVTKHNWMKSTI